MHDSKSPGTMSRYQPTLHSVNANIKSNFSKDLPTEAVLDKGSSNGALLSMFADVSREKYTIPQHIKKKFKGDTIQVSQVN